MSDCQVEADDPKRSLDLLDWALSTAGVGWWIFIPEDFQLQVSSQFYHLFDMEPGLRLTTSELERRIHHEDILSFRKYRERAHRGLPFTTTYRIPLAGGIVRELRVQCESRRTPQQKIALFGIVQEVTEQRHLERALAESNAFLEKSEKLAAVGQLAAGIAHEIRNPLTAIKGFTQFLYERAHHDDQSHLSIMLSELERIQTILGELLVLAKPQEPMHRLCSVQSLLADVRTLLEAQCRLGNVVIDIECEEGLPDIVCEPNQLKQVFINVMKNGIEAMEAGGRLSVDVRRAGPSLRVSIVDTGIGIPSDEIPRLGDAFYTTKASGTGLGVLMSQRIVRSHGGSMRIESEVGKGTTVDINLPLQAMGGLHDVKAQLS